MLKPTNSIAYYNKGIALNRLKKFEEAIECYDKTIELNPIDSFALNNKGICLYSLKKYKESIQCFEKAIEIEFDFDFMNNKNLASKLLKLQSKDTPIIKNKNKFTCHCLENYNKALVQMYCCRKNEIKKNLRVIKKEKINKTWSSLQNSFDSVKEKIKLLK